MLEMESDPRGLEGRPVDCDVVCNEVEYATALDAEAADAAPFEGAEDATDSFVIWRPSAGSGTASSGSISMFLPAVDGAPLNSRSIVLDDGLSGRFELDFPVGASAGGIPATAGGSPSADAGGTSTSSWSPWFGPLLRGDGERRFARPKWIPSWAADPAPAPTLLALPTGMKTRTGSRTVNVRSSGTWRLSRTTVMLVSAESSNSRLCDTGISYPQKCRCSAERGSSCRTNFFVALSDINVCVCPCRDVFVRVY